MAEAQPLPAFEIDLGANGGKLSFSSPNDLFSWLEKERQFWRWLANVPQPLNSLYQAISQRYGEIEGFTREWDKALAVGNVKEAVKQMHLHLQSTFSTSYGQKRILHSSHIDAVFISKLKQEEGETAAAAAYAVLVKHEIRVGQGGFNQPGMSQPIAAGLFNALLYQRNIDWTGAAEAEMMERLRKDYEERFQEQDGRFQEIEARNTQLNEAFLDRLTKNTAALESLHGEMSGKLNQLHTDQSQEFKKAFEKHVDNLKAIEETYNQKLALQKPVGYWETQKTLHDRRSMQFGITAFVLLLLVGAGLGFAVHKFLGDLKPGENPKHWQLGILIVAVFFSIWLIRIIVRIFLSHLHLARDADERRTMILTYLSMAREGSPFAPEDKRLILQHIFRSASDGLVRDDAAPPTFLEYFSRDQSKP